ncbi:MAG: type II toxin-antitoxin system RelE/ParE family toxin [Planctomycetia bacterium]
MIYNIHGAAAADLQSAAEHYSKSASQKVAERFIAEFHRVAELVSRFPRIGGVYRDAHRRLTFRRFPYSIVYKEIDGRIFILAVAHHRRLPGYWLDRE